MIATRTFVHNGKTYEKGQAVNLPDGDIAILNGMNLLEVEQKPEPKLKAKDA